MTAPKILWKATAAVFSLVSLFAQPPRTGFDSSSGKLSDVSQIAPHGTIIVSVACAEGLILAGDSRLSWTTPEISPGYKVLSDYNSKLFETENMGIATYGLAFIAGRSISGWVSDFRAQLPKLKADETRDVDQLADELSEYIGKAYFAAQEKNKTKPRLGFVVAGYDSKHRMGKLLQIEFPEAAKPVLLFDTQSTGAAWMGETSAISRIVKGYDSSLKSSKPFTALSKDQQTALTEELEKKELNIPFDAMMMQDGVDLATSLVRITVEMQRFAYGTKGSPGEIPGVGGSVDVLIVLPTGSSG